MVKGRRIQKQQLTTQKYYQKWQIKNRLHCNHLCLVESLTHLQVNLLWHFWSTNVLAICPWQRISKNVCCDCPVACAKVNPSAMVAIKLPWTMLRINIILAAFPASPASLDRTKLISHGNMQHQSCTQPTRHKWKVVVPMKKDVFPIAWKQLLQSS